MLTIDEGYRALRAGTGAAVVVPRDVVEVAGPEAETFLQGQLSQDVARLAPGASTPSFLLDPTGKLGFWLRVTRLGPERFVLDLDAGFGEQAIARLTRFKLRTKVTIAALDWQCATLDRAGESTAATADGDGDDSSGAASITGDEVRVAAGWPGAAGTDVLAPAGTWVAAAEADGHPLAPAEALEAIRIESGVPALGTDLTVGETIPAEAGVWVIDASVSFTKGCYTGQELVARIDSRGGNVPRRLQGLVIEAPVGAAPVPGDEVLVDDQVVAAITSAAWSPAFEAVVALAMVPRSVAVPGSAVVRSAAGDHPARLLALPLVDPSA